MNDKLKDPSTNGESWLELHFRRIFNDGRVTWGQIIQVRFISTYIKIVVK